MRERALEDPERSIMERRRGYQQTRAKRLGARFVEYVDPLVVLEADDGACGICGEDVDPDRFDIDHTFPLGPYGEHSYANVQAAHPACNRRKGGRILEEAA